MPTRNINVPMQLLILGISLASALQIDVPASNNTVDVNEHPIQTINSLPTARLTELLVSTTPAAATKADEITQDQIIGTVKGTANSTINETVLNPTGFPVGAISIKKGGGAAGSRGSGSSGGSSGGGGGGTGGSGYGSSPSNGGNRGSSVSSTNWEYPFWFPLGGGIFETPPEKSGSASKRGSSDKEWEYPVWFPLGGGLFEPPSTASASVVRGSMIVLRAVALACGTVLIVYGML